jgi:hypothetical protein
MKRRVALLAVFVFFGCSAKTPVPPFDIQVTLSDAARQKLETAGETIKVAIYFDGDGAPQPGEKTAPSRQVYLGKHVVELRQPGRIRIAEARISEEAVGRLSDPNYHFTINVFSGRRVFSDNVLRNGYAAGLASDLNPTTPIILTCDLLK